MTSVATNDNNDMFLDGQNNLSMVTGIQACLQDCQHVAQVRLGEMVLATDVGMPYFQSVFNNTNPDQFKQALITAWLQVPNVTDVLGCSVIVIGNTLSYEAVIATTFGRGTING